ncbi:uncharacterized protein LOC133519688 [Cydia pomonella]|uniref:uncharacterized protein LOC133519688 n=1 Tax=Cydia pomonella TaxID=82600 RepID=UPI002ADE477F|nr:uncharacterized protein LOC133519688 [Cydia pomonella]
MVSLKIHLLATIMLISKAYCQVATSGGSPQRYGSATPTIVPGGQFIVPAIIKPLLPSCQKAAPAQPASGAPNKQTPAAFSASVPFVDDDDDSELDKLLYLLISNIIESKKGSGKKQSNPSSIFDSSASPSDGYDVCASSYADDYDYCSYSPSVAYSSGSNSGGSDGSCPEICVFVRPADC